MIEADFPDLAVEGKEDEQQRGSIALVNEAGEQLHLLSSDEISNEELVRQIMQKAGYGAKEAMA